MNDIPEFKEVNAFGVKLWVDMDFEFFNEAVIFKEFRFINGLFVDVFEDGLFVFDECLNGLVVAIGERFGGWKVGVRPIFLVECVSCFVIIG